MNPNQEKLNEIFKELEFKTWLEQEEKEKPKEVSIKKANYELINTKESLEGLVKKMKASSIVSIDTETDGLDYMDVNLVGISISTKKRRRFIHTLAS